MPEKELLAIDERNQARASNQKSEQDRGAFLPVQVETDDLVETENGKNHQKCGRKDRSRLEAGQKSFFDPVRGQEVCVAGVSNWAEGSPQENESDASKACEDELIDEKCFANILKPSLRVSQTVRDPSQRKKSEKPRPSAVCQNQKKGSLPFLRKSGLRLTRVTGYVGRFFLRILDGQKRFPPRDSAREPVLRHEPMQVDRRLLCRQKFDDALRSFALESFPREGSVLA